MSGTQAYYELYRQTSVGQALTDTLDDLISDNRIQPQLAIKILFHFDRIMTETLADKVKARLSFKVKDLNIKLENQNQVTTDRVKIVSCNSKRPGEV
ncbi:MAG: Gtf2a2p [Candelina mexicana]|nr:MAG: Gtf2a2p [Candelina mexicana]